eukprot:GHVO01068457.1.p1 GENE.GHVO01068457.1~~GHVO01068457.1.p1  ORF type:complete len:762 (-),score=117.54 GHVO01068457.1:444-2465(-)
MDGLYPKAVEGFLFLVTSSGDLTYVSESVSLYLGLTQLDLIGHSIFDFSHPCDHDELQEIFQEKNSSSKDSRKAPSCHERDFFVRMKCTLTSKGKSVNLKSATYKVLHCSGYYVSPDNASAGLLGLQDDPTLSSIMVIAEPIPHPANIEVPLDSRTFLSRHSLNMKFTYCDDRVDELLHYPGSELVGRSMYEYQHALDTDSLDKAFKTLFSKGQTITGKYRFLAKDGGYAWVETQATVIYDSRTEKPQCVVCVNFVISGIEEKGVVLSKVQCIEESVTKMELDDDSSPSNMKFSTMEILQKKSPKPPVSKKTPTIQLGFEDLAPVAGGDPTPLLDDDDINLYDDVLFPPRHSLMPPNPPIRRKDPPLTKANVAAAAAKISNDMLKTISKKDLPFISLRQDIINDSPASSSSCSPNSTVSSLTSSAASLSSPPPLLNLSITSDQKLTEVSESELIDIDCRAPYISMDGTDDLTFGIKEPVPLIIDDEFSSNQMLGITESMFCPNPDVKPDESTNQQHLLPLNILRLQSNNKNIPSVGEIARNAGPPKMKRPMETNRLETGPPVVKLGRYEEPPSVSRDPDSILKNLLTQGEDVNYGYKLDLQPAQMMAESPQPLCSQMQETVDEASVPSLTAQQIRALLLEAVSQPVQPLQPALNLSPQALQQMLAEARMVCKF